MTNHPKRPWWRRWPTITLVVVAVAGAVTGALLTRSTTAVTYRDVVATSGTIDQTVSMTGTLEATNQRNLNFSVSGRVTSVPVAVGQTVTAGQTLATVGTTNLDLALSQAGATFSAAKAKLAADTAAKAADDSSVSDAQIDSDNSSLAAAFTGVLSAQQDVTDATLTAPIAGTLVAVNVATGDTVSGSTSSSASSSPSSSASSAASSPSASSGQGGPSGSSSAAASSSAASSSSSSSSNADFVIQDLTSFQVTGTVSAANVASVKVGQDVTITPSSSTSTVTGTVASIASVPTISNGAATFAVVITVTGSTDGLYSGTSATAAIVVSQSSNLVIVPTAAVHRSGTSTYVEKVVGGKQVRTPVTVSTSANSSSGLSSGLSAGDTVAVEVVTAATGTGTGTTGRTGFGGAGFGGAGGGGFPTGGPPSGAGGFGG